ncbi:DUF4132 domain-containing protein [Glycomyces rhizosphaerae]|uniref:DUF4132 domain-containing protein n=1 Tax=Glycomyces rhizosphaerae TaxID=2054422 RepID=A0ABV7Q4B5_9ACTN
MTEALAPQEDQVHFPRNWERYLKPTRSSGKPRKVALDEDQGGLLYAEHEVWARAILDQMLHERFKPSGFAFLDGTPDPVGAAVVTTVICHNIGGNPVTTEFIERKAAASRAMFHRLIADHGLPFAAEAAAMFFTLDTGRDPGKQVRLRQMHLNGHGWGRSVPDGLLTDFRHLITAASDTEYAAVREALARQRTNPAERLAVALLVPDEREWTDEVCSEHRGQNRGVDVTELLLLQAVTTVDQLDTLQPLRIPPYHLNNPELACLVGRLGAAAAPIVIDSVKDTHPVAWRRRLHKALAMLPSDEAADYLAERLYESDVMGFAIEFAQRFPLRMLRVVADRLQGAGPARRELLFALLNALPAFGSALPHLDTEARAVLEPLFADDRRLPEADPSELPPLLTTPPWTAKGPKRKAVVIAGLEPPAINRVVWAADEREVFANAGYDFSDTHDEDRWDQDARRLELRNLPSEDGLHLLAHAPLAIAAPLADRWHFRPPLGIWARHELQRVLARFEATVSEQVARAASADASCREAALPIANLTAARDMADAFTRLKSLRTIATAWLDRHSADAAVLLIPDALGADKKARKPAETALRYLAASHGPDLVREAAARYGDEAVAALAAIEETDPLLPVGVKIPKPVAWAAPALLPQVLLAGGERALPLDAVEHLLTVLAFTTPEFAYAGVEVIAETCDRASLGRFSLDVFERWLNAGAPTAESWALSQLAHFADDHTVRTLAPLVAAWPGVNQHQRAVKGLQVLGAIGTETAMRAIQTIAEKAKFDAIRWEAGQQIEIIAKRLGLTAEQLADRLVPDFGLGDAAALVIDYGPRKFTVTFDEQLKPFVRDGDGKPRKTLPKPGAKDDGAAAEDAYRRFTALKKDLRTVAADLVKRLEAAMVNGRTWTVAEFGEHLVRHALVGHLARRLVWIAEHQGARTGFRIAEDGSFSNVDDETFTPAEASTIRVAHPALFDPKTAQAWAELLADYEVLQPFDQMNRPVMAFTEEDLATGRLPRFEGGTVEVGPLLGITKRGWLRAAPAGGGVEPGISFALTGSGYLTVMLDPGIYTGSVSALPDQKIVSVCLSQIEDYGVPLAPDGKRLKDIDPVSASEALAGLARLTKRQ